MKPETVVNSENATFGRPLLKVGVSVTATKNAPTISPPCLSIRSAAEDHWQSGLLQGKQDLLMFHWHFGSIPASTSCGERVGTCYGSLRYT